MSYRKLPWNTNVEDYTPTIGGSPTLTASAGKHFVDQNGIMHCNGYADISAAGAASQVTINIPDGYEIDTSRLASGTSTANDVAVPINGTFEWFDSGNAYYDITAYYASSTTIAFHYSPGLLLANQFASGDGLKWNFSIPVK